MKTFVVSEKELDKMKRELSKLGIVVSWEHEPKYLYFNKITEFNVGKSHVR